MLLGDKLMKKPTTTRTALLFIGVDFTDPSILRICSNENQSSEIFSLSWCFCDGGEERCPCYTLRSAECEGQSM